MKKIAVMIAAAVTLVPALAQGQTAGIPSNGLPVRPRLPLVSTAHAPLVSSTGETPTRADKAEFMASARRAFTASDTASSAGPSGMSDAMESRGIPATETITVAEPSAASGFSMVAENPYIWDPDRNALVMNPLGTAQQSYLGLYVEVAPNTIYVLTFKVRSNSAGDFVIATAPTRTPVGAQTAKTVTVPLGDGGFLYAFDATASGGVWIWVSAKVKWSFESVQLTPMPM